MTDISVIILQRNEALHIKRCLEMLVPLEPKEIFVIDCFSTDGSAEEVKRIGEGEQWKGRLYMVQHEWPGNQAAQFNWALNNLTIEGTWILRIDADEYLLPELIEEIKRKLPMMNERVDGVIFKRRHVVGWLRNKWVKRGMYPARILRLFRAGRGKSDQKIMDEHIVVKGEVVEFEHDFVDHSLISFEEWKEKHRGYAKREAKSYLSGERSEGEKAAKKDAYYKFPPYLRVIMYFCIRFFLKGAIFEGPKAWKWCWYHAMWYRWMVDKEIGRMKNARD